MVHDVKQSKSVAYARAVKCPALSVDEPSELSKSVADAGAVEGPALSVDEPSELSKIRCLCKCSRGSSIVRR